MLEHIYRWQKATQTRTDAGVFALNTVKVNTAQNLCAEARRAVSLSGESFEAHTYQAAIVIAALCSDSYAN